MTLVVLLHQVCECSRPARLIVGSDTNKKRGRQAAKLAKVSRALLADRVILATDQSSWPEADLERVRTAANAEFRGLPVPRVEAMTDL